MKTKQDRLKEDRAKVRAEYARLATLIDNALNDLDIEADVDSTRFGVSIMLASHSKARAFCKFLQEYMDAQEQNDADALLAELNSEYYASRGL